LRESNRLFYLPLKGNARLGRIVYKRRGAIEAYSIWCDLGFGSPHKVYLGGAKKKPPYA